MHYVKNKLLRRANKKFAEKSYGDALSLYKQAIEKNPYLEKILSFNIYTTEKKLGRHNEMYENKDCVINKNIKFDSKFYLKQNPDVKYSNQDPEDHYWNFGEREGRWPNSEFDPNYYLNVNADVRCKGVSPFGHFIDIGYQEGRMGKKQISEFQKKGSANELPLLFVGHDGLMGGAQKVLLEIIRWFHMHTRRRIKILLLSPGILGDQYASLGELYVMPSRSETDSIKELVSFLDEEFQVCYLNTVVSGQIFNVCEKYGIKLKGDVLTHIHELEDVLEQHQNEFNNLKSNSKFWISASPATSKLLTHRYKINQKEFVTIPAFIDASKKNIEINNDRLKKRELLGLNSGDFVVVGCGTVYPLKGVDIFIKTARKIINLGFRNVKFVWIGNGPEYEKYNLSILPEESNNIRMLGFQHNASELLVIADLFYLSSRQDAFPLVVLEAAMYEVPALCFGPATGITEFIGNDAGIALDEISHEKAAGKIVYFVENPNELKKFGHIANNRLVNEYSTEIQCLKIFEILKNKFGYKPSVSVIVPFYNHEKYVKKRLQTICSQSIKDIEIIVADDFSKDQTRFEINYFKNDIRVQTIFNQKNSGSPFLQWKRGIDVAVSDFVWIAEGDDFCDLNFLETLLPAFDDSTINIAASRTEKVDENDKLELGAFDEYLNKYCIDRYSESFIATGASEVCAYYGAHQTLINASGIVLRKVAIGRSILEAATYKICGDWIVYLECLRTGKLFYSIDTVNYFRRHEQSQVSKLRGNLNFFDERKKVIQFLIESYSIPKSLFLKAIQSTKDEWLSLNDLNVDGFDSYFDASHLSKIWRSSKSRLSVLLVISSFSPGGGEIFKIRLANSLAHNIAHVAILCVDHDPINFMIRDLVDPCVPVYHSKDVSIKDLVEIYQVDVIHSSIWWADKFVHQSLKDVADNIKWVLTMHGCYEALAANPSIDGSFNEIFTEMRYEVDHWVYIADKNLRVFNGIELPEKLSKINNGYKKVEISDQFDNLLEFRRGTFVASLVSRAREDKGWKKAIDAVTLLNNSGYLVDLVLVGDGPYSSVLDEMTLPSYIHRVGHVNNVHDFINISDIGLLPSMFVSESMPLSIIEFMAYGKPIVASDVGEIRVMTQDDYGSGSILLELKEGEIDFLELAEGIKETMNKSRYKELAINSARRFQDYEMSVMIRNYINLYRSVCTKP